MIGRLGILKTVLWAAVGVLAAATVARFTQGLGATTNLSDATPWGIWIAFDVMCGVALAAGGFVMAATVYIFGLERYRPFVRPAVLTAFLGYAAVATGLAYDLGHPWRIWHPMIFPQIHSVLFEVAMCVMLYLTVLALEFAPVALEHPLLAHPLLQKVHAVLKKVTIVLVIAGIVLSTLHQSSLGSLFLIAPYRVHPLWYSPIVYVLFFTSAIALGLMMVTMESLLSGFFFGHTVRKELLAGLGRAARVVLGLYLVLRLGDLTWRGLLGTAFDGSWQSFLFWFELALTAIVPIVLLSIGTVRNNIKGIAVCSAMTILGVMLYRFDICIITFARPEGMAYWPSWLEVAISCGIVSGAVLVFIFFVENLKVYSDHGDDTTAPAPVCGPDTVHNLVPAVLGAPRRYSLTFVIAAALTFALMPQYARLGDSLELTPVKQARTVDGVAHQRPDGAGNQYLLAEFSPRTSAGPGVSHLLMIDGNRDGRFVLFPHELHKEKMGGEASCAKCHHQHVPFDKNTACSVCHADMYETTDIFEHDLHVDKLGGNAGCVRCHADASAPKTRSTATACKECHADMNVAGARIKTPDGGLKGFAPGYMEVMHTLCVECHKEDSAAKPNAYGAAFARCDGCHGLMDGSNLTALEPYVQVSSQNKNTYRWKEAARGTQ